MQAGITTTLNSRCSVLAAANSVFGRWDDTKGEEVREEEGPADRGNLVQYFYFLCLIRTLTSCLPFCLVLT